MWYWGVWLPGVWRMLGEREGWEKTSSRGLASQAP